MELLDNQKQDKFQTFSFGNIKVIFDELIGKHIIELAKILKKSALNRETYIRKCSSKVL